MDWEEEDFVFYGTPIEREEEIMSRKKKALAEASGHLRSVAPWNQEVTDEEGRRRFHGAFTGGFSAGYYNTVGSKEGWTPQSFTSSRKSRAEVKKQSISDFLDEDEKDEFMGQTLGTASQFDTFGFTAAEFARKRAEMEQSHRPSTIPGPAPDEIVLPVTESIGVKLLMKMGWRRGHSVKDLRASSDARREARKAFLAFCSNAADQKTMDTEQLGVELESSALQPDNVQFPQSTPVFVLNPKRDVHGLGFDPYKHAPEFRERKRSRSSTGKESSHKKLLSMRESLFGYKSKKVAPGFGIGALEELGAEDEDVYTCYECEETYVEEDEEPSAFSRDDKPKILGKEQQGVLPGFRVSSETFYKLERFEPPKIPKDFIPQHKFSGPLENTRKFDVPPPLEVPPPDDNNLKLLIEGVAALVARCGKLFEDLSREKNQSNALFDFLNGGKGHDYYERKLWEQQQKHKDLSKLLDVKGSLEVPKMTAETRGKLLGEKPLEKTPIASSGKAVQFPVNLSDTFITPKSFNEVLEDAKPFKDDPAKQERFELFLKEKYQGGLRLVDYGRTDNMTEAVRARERLDFEAAAETIERGRPYNETKPTTEQAIGFLPAGNIGFRSGGLEKVNDVDTEVQKLKHPKREEFQWRPAPLLCKRFDILDPYMGKPPPAPRSKSKMDSLFVLPDAKAAGVPETMTQAFVSEPTIREAKKIADENNTEVMVEVENVERPVDLYKAIFSDEEEEEEEKEEENSNGIVKQNEAAASTLNRLMAGDFLESLGKELGLEVPPETVYSERKPLQPEAPQNDVRKSKAQTNGGKILEQGRVSQDSQGQYSGTVQSRSGDYYEGPSGRTFGRSDVEHITQATEDGRTPSLLPDAGHGTASEKDDTNNMRKEKLSFSQDNRWSSSDSSRDEKRRKRYKQDHRGGSDSYSDSSDDYKGHRGSKSSGKKAGSSKGKSERKRSRHRKHKSKKSSSRYSSDDKPVKSRKGKRKQRD